MTAVVASRTDRSNFAALAKLLAVLIALITIFSVVFHLLMEREGQHHSWATGVYWTLTVMSTLGFGDITFASDAGRIFSLIVLLTGVVFLLVLLPFTFIEFFYAPWMKAQESAKAPRTLPTGTEGHVIFTNYGPVARYLVQMLDEYGYRCYYIIPNLERALELRNEGVPVIVGEHSDPDTYAGLHIDKAAMVVTTLDDVSNTNVTFTVREYSDNVPIVASATSDSVRDALDLAGVTHVLRLDEMMGQALARRVLGNDSAAHVIGNIDNLVIAEASPGRTSLVGKTIAETQLRSHTGVSIVGLWTHGQFRQADADSKITSVTILILAGTNEQIECFNEIYGQDDGENHQVVIVGGGRVGRATAIALSNAGVEWTLIEKDQERVRGLKHTLIGDASDLEMIEKSGIQDAATVVITTHDDELNIFLTIFYRRLRHGLQIISRSTRTRNVSRLHRAGANLVLSYASMGANIIFNVLRGSDTLLLAEGVNIFSVDVPPSLAGKLLAESEVRSRCGCTVIAIELEGKRDINPDPQALLTEGSELVLVGALEAERQFRKIFKPG